MTTPHITLEIPTVNYGQFLSPIHEVPTPLPSPAHTPIPSLKRTTVGGCAISESSLSSCSSTRLERKRSQLQQQRRNYNSPDVIYRSDSSAPSILIDTVSDSPIESQERPSISIVVPSAIQIRIESDSPSPSTLSSASNSPLPSPAKTKPPPLNIVNSNFTRFDGLVTGSETNQFRPTPPLRVPLLCVSEPSPDTDYGAVVSEKKSPLVQAVGQAAKQSQQHNKSMLGWQHVNLGSPPLRKLPVTDVTVNAVDVNSINDANMRRAFKDTLDKSSSLDLPHPPPMITITANFSEVESDSDAGMLGKYIDMDYFLKCYVVSCCVSRFDRFFFQSSILMLSLRPFI